MPMSNKYYIIMLFSLQSNLITEDRDAHVKRMPKYSVYKIPPFASGMDESDIALEQAVMNLDLGDNQESSDSEVEWEEEIEPHVNVPCKQGPTLSDIGELYLYLLGCQFDGADHTCIHCSRR